MEKHVTLVAVLKIAFGILGLCLTLCILLIMTGCGILSYFENCDFCCGSPDEVAGIIWFAAFTIGLLIIIISALKIIGGIGLLKHKPWARVLVLIISCIELIDIPVGTAIGIYTLWVLLHDDTVKLFKSEEGTVEAVDNS